MRLFTCPIWQAYLGSYPFSKAMRTRAIDYFYYTYNKKQVEIPVHAHIYAVTF